MLYSEFYCLPAVWCNAALSVNWPAPRGDDVYCPCMCARVRAYVRTYVRMYVRAGEACLGTSTSKCMSVAENECNVGSDGWLRTSAYTEAMLYRASDLTDD